MSSKISIIIATYNQKKYLKEAIKSVLSQTYRDFELLIWDDGSTDGSIEIAKELTRNDKRVRIVKAPHQGVAMSRVAALAQTTGEYIGWVDSDDLLGLTALEETAAVLDQNPKVGMVYTDYVDIDAAGKIVGHGFRCNIPYSKDRLLVDFMTFHFRLIRRSIYEQVGGINPVCAYAYEYDLCLRISEVTEIFHLKKPLYFYRTHPNNISSTRAVDQILWSQWAIAEALKRRGLDDKIQVDVEMLQVSFVLRRKQPLDAEETPDKKSSNHQKSNNTIQEISSTPRTIPPIPRANLKRFMCWGLFPLLLTILNVGVGNAQQITPAKDGTNTIINSNGDRIDIMGGAVSHDGTNLFHSFSEFGLQSNQIANFIANPQLQNILGRVTGGNASVINGLIQITGGNANLYLTNPSGFVFGENASISIPGAFTATTANRIGFDNGWFNSIGTNDYAILIGNPNAFAFTASQPGAIINLGNLTVGNQQNLNLLAGNVINTGLLKAPGGQILVTSVPGENLIRLSQPGSLLSLEIQPLSSGSHQNTVVSLPELLTVGNIGDALTVSDGNVTLANQVTVPVASGTTIVSGSIDAGSNSGNGGAINILGKQVGLVRANIDVSGTDGGVVKIGGDLQGKGSLANANQTYVDANSVIQANAGENGNGGQVIVWSNDTTNFFGGINARGGRNSGNGGFVEVSGKNYLTFRGDVDTSAVNGSNGTLLLDPSTLTIIDAPRGTGSFDTNAGNIIFATPNNGANTISWGAIAALGFGANINLQATGDITINPITGNTPGVTSLGRANLSLGNGGSFNLKSQEGAVVFANQNDTIKTSGGAINISGASLAIGNLDTSGNFANGGDINLSAIDNIKAGDIIATGFGYSLIGGGNIVITSTAGALTLGNLNTSAESRFTNATSGIVELNAFGNITTGGIDTSSTNSSNSARAGNINVTSNKGSINLSALNASANSVNNATAGNINIDASNNNTNTSTSSDITLSSAAADASVTGQSERIADSASPGSITIKTSGSGSVRVTNTFSNVLGKTTSISAASQITNRSNEILPTLFVANTNTNSSNPNQITIQHGGGKTNAPFIVGDASLNGAAGTIDTGSAVISSGNFLVLPTGGIAPGTGGTSNITISSVNSPPTLTANPLLPKTEVNQAVTFAFTDLAATATDINGDVTSIIVDKVNVGTLAVNGNPVIPGVTKLTSGDALTYTPLDNTGNNGLLNAFTIIASDGVSLSTPVQIRVNVTQPQPPEKPPQLPEKLPELTEKSPESPKLEVNLDYCFLFDCRENASQKVNDSVRTSSILGIVKTRPVLDTTPTPEDRFTNRIARHLGIEAPLSLKTLDDAQDIASAIEKATGIKPAFMYLSFVPVEVEATASNKSSKQTSLLTEQDSDELEIIVVTAKGKPIRKRIAGATRGKVLETAREFRNQIANRKNIRRNTYLAPGQQLHEWIVAPIEAELAARKIDNLVFIADVGLRSTPLAALHNGKEFLIEKYSVGLMPSLSLTNTLYTDIKNSQVLATGVSQSTQGQPPLPAVPQELSTLVFKLWQGKLLLNEQATFQNITNIRRNQPFGIIHMATHADFTTGSVGNSYIQLWEDKLRLNQIRKLGLNNPQVEMMVLSACRTALGDEEAEIGFAGLAILAGVKTSVASLWAVDDAGTASLMTSFYENLRKAPIRAEALRQAQAAMAKGQVSIKNGQVHGLGLGLSLPTNSQIPDGVLSHPYYWAAFTMVGNPW